MDVYDLVGRTHGVLPGSHVILVSGYCDIAIKKGALADYLVNLAG